MTVWTAKANALIAAWISKVKELTGDLIGVQIGPKHMAAMVWPAIWIAEVIALSGDWIVAETEPNVVLIVGVIGLIATWTTKVKGLTGDLIGVQIGPNAIFIVEVNGLGDAWIAEEHVEVVKVIFMPAIVPITGWRGPGIVACGMVADKIRRI